MLENELQNKNKKKTKERRTLCVVCALLNQHVWKEAHTHTDA